MRFASQCAGECSKGRYSAMTGLGASPSRLLLCFVQFSDCAHSYTMPRTLFPSVTDSQCSGFCTVGRYSDATGKTGEIQCKDCEVGKFADSVGFPLCKDCPAGKAQSATKKTACALCSRGKYEDEGGASRCKLCHQGSFSQRDGMIRSVCIDCMGGRWTNVTGAEMFEDCTKLQCPIFSLADRPLMSIQYTNNRELPSLAMVSCAHGYTTSWDPSIICIWSGLPRAYYSRVAGRRGMPPSPFELTLTSLRRHSRPAYIYFVLQEISRTGSVSIRKMSYRCASASNARLSWLRSMDE